MKKKVTIAIICVVIVAGVMAFFLKPSAKNKVELETAKVEKIDIRNSVTATGSVEPVTEVEVGTQVSGIVDRLFVDFNDEVTAGQVIALMDKINLEAELQSAQAQLSSAKTEYDYRQKEFNRTKALYEKELISESEYDAAYYQFETSKNAYNQAQASITKVKRNLSYATITSPIDGVVISRAVEEGQTVAAGFETPTLFTIAKDLTKMQIIANVDEADIGQVLEGQRVEFNVDAYPDDTFEGTVYQVRLEAKTESNVVTYEVVIKAENPDLKLKPGLTANITIFTEEKMGVISVPNKALKFNPEQGLMAMTGVEISGAPAEGNHVWVLNGNSITSKAVKTGSSYNDKIEVSGINEGETVVVGVSMLSSEMPEAGKAPERSPFMPTPPGGNKQGGNKK